MNIKIDKEFKDLIHPLTDEEFKKLQENILSDGLREPMVYWKEKEILLDGHNRHEICQKHDIPMQFVSESFMDRDRAMIWMLDQQGGRRNSTPEQRRFLVGLRFNLEKNMEKFKGNQHISGVPQIEGHQIHTSIKMAKANNCSRSTIERSANYATGVEFIASQAKDPGEAKREILTGKGGLTMAGVQTIGRVAKKDPEEAKALLNRKDFKPDSFQPFPIPMTLEADRSWEKTTAKTTTLDRVYNFGVAVKYVEMAIMQLESIPKSAHDREDAFAMLLTWIEKNR